MKIKNKLIITTIVLFIAIINILIFKNKIVKNFYTPTTSQLERGVGQKKINEPITDTNNPTNLATTQKITKDIEVIIKNLQVPWEIAFMSDDEFLVTERPGRLLKIDKTKQIIPISGVHSVGEGGLLGLTLHPNFSKNHWLYLYLTTKNETKVSNSVERYKIIDATLSDRKIIISDIPGSIYHDGGRIAFGPDGNLYITTGDAGNSKLAQDKNSLAGKILRLKDDGAIPRDNPFGNAVYSYGHRNPQGLAWDDKGRLWATEHGRSGVLSGLDELNLIERGKNYGWPIIQGNEKHVGMETPVINSGPNETWAPAGIAFLNNRLFFAGLRGESLYEAQIDERGNILKIKTYFRNEFGRLRAVQVGLDGFLYITTSNTDGRGKVRAGDDKLIRINPAIFNQ